MRVAVIDIRDLNLVNHTYSSRIHMLDWYDDVQEIQGDVFMNSIGQPAKDSPLGTAALL